MSNRIILEVDAGIENNINSHPENTISLEFKPNITVLAGFRFGRDTFLSQSPKKLDLTEDFYIHFPNQIACIASSFVNGFFEKIVPKIGLSEAINRVHITGGKDCKKLEKDIKIFLLKGFDDDDDDNY